MSRRLLQTWRYAKLGFFFLLKCLNVCLSTLKILGYLNCMWYMDPVPSRWMWEVNEDGIHRVKVSEHWNILVQGTVIYILSLAYLVHCGPTKNSIFKFHEHALSRLFFCFPPNLSGLKPWPHTQLVECALPLSSTGCNSHPNAHTVDLTAPFTEQLLAALYRNI